MIKYLLKDAFQLDISFILSIGLTDVFYQRYCYYFVLCLHCQNQRLNLSINKDISILVHNIFISLV